MTYVYKVPEIQLGKLYEVREKTGIPIARHIRKAIDDYLEINWPGGDLHKILNGRREEREDR